MKTRCPHCGEEQKPNSPIGDLDECDGCGEVYQQFSNEIPEDQ